MFLGELLLLDRARAGLTQDQLAVRLNSTRPRPIDPFTKKEKTAHRTWIAKIEAGTLKRELRLEVREWLAATLNGDKEKYRSLSLWAEPPKGETDLAREQADFLRNGLARFDMGSLIRIDSPASGPLSNQQPHLLLLLAGIVTKCNSVVAIFSNELAPAGKNPPNTLHCTMLLHAVVGELAKDVASPTTDKLRDHFAKLEWSEHIEVATRRVFEAAQGGRHDEMVKLSKPAVAWLEKHLTVHILKSSPEAPDRYNPLTIVLAKSVSDSKLSACIMDGRHLPWDCADASTVAQAFDERRRLFKAFRPSPDEIIEHADLFGIKLQFPK